MVGRQLCGNVRSPNWPRSDALQNIKMLLRAAASMAFSHAVSSSVVGAHVHDMEMISTPSSTAWWIACLFEHLVLARQCKP
jgi:hypothetical protein